MNFHKILNGTGVGGSDSAACKNEIYQFLQMLLTIFSINYCYFSFKLTTLLYLLFDEFLSFFFLSDTCNVTQIRHSKMELLTEKKKNISKC